MAKLKGAKLFIGGVEIKGHQVEDFIVIKRKRKLMGDWNAEPPKHQQPLNRCLCPHCPNFVHATDTTCPACGGEIKHED